MTAKSDVRPMEDPEGPLEQALIREFLHERGYDPPALDALPDDQRKHLMEEASVYAAGKLAEVEARARFVHKIHGEE